MRLLKSVFIGKDIESLNKFIVGSSNKLTAKQRYAVAMDIWKKKFN